MVFVFDFFIVYLGKKRSPRYFMFVVPLVASANTRHLNAMSKSAQVRVVY